MYKVAPPSREILTRHIYHDVDRRCRTATSDWHQQPRLQVKNSVTVSSPSVGPMCTPREQISQGFV